MLITLYSDPRSGSCRRVLAVVNHLGIELQEVFVDLLAGGNQSKEFLALNPAGLVPVMTVEHGDGGNTLLSEAAVT